MRFVLPIAFVFYCYSISAQENNNTLGVTLSIGSIQLQEKALNNIKHTGILTDLGVYYEVRSQSEFIHRVSFSLAWGSLKSKYEEEKNSDYSHPSLSYSLLKSLSNRVNLGGYFSGGYQVMEFENWDDSHLYWLTSYQIRASLEFIPLNKLFTRVKFPLLSVVSRSRNEITNKVDSDEFSDIFKLIHSNAVLATPLKYQTLDFQIAYIFTDFKKLSLEINTSLKFAHANLQKSKEFTYSSIVAGLELKYKLN